MSKSVRAVSLLFFCVSAPLRRGEACAAEPPRSPEEFVRAFAVALGEADAASLQALFLPEGALRAQARTLHQLARGRALTDRRLYSAPDREPAHGLVKLRLDEPGTGAVLVLGLRVDDHGGWRVTTKPSLEMLEKEGGGKTADLRFEIRVLTAMMGGVSLFVEEMTKIYGTGPAPTAVP